MATLRRGNDRATYPRLSDRPLLAQVLRGAAIAGVLTAAGCDLSSPQVEGDMPALDIGYPLPDAGGGAADSGLPETQGTLLAPDIGHARPDAGGGEVDAGCDTACPISPEPPTAGMPEFRCATDRDCAEDEFCDATSRRCLPVQVAGAPPAPTLPSEGP